MSHTHDRALRSSTLGVYRVLKKLKIKNKASRREKMQIDSVSRKRGMGERILALATI